MSFRETKMFLGDECVLQNAVYKVCRAGCISQDQEVGTQVIQSRWNSKQKPGLENKLKSATEKVWVWDLQLLLWNLFLWLPLNKSFFVTQKKEN